MTQIVKNEMGPKVKANLENNVPFEVVFFDDEPNRMYLNWPDNSCLCLHFSKFEMRSIQIWADEWLAANAT